MDSKWIIIVVKDDKYALPITGDDDTPATFDTQEEAQKCADEHHLCRMFGGWLFDISTGEVEAY
jgi:hypothetical protein